MISHFTMVNSFSFFALLTLPTSFCLSCPRDLGKKDEKNEFSWFEFFARTMEQGRRKNMKNKFCDVSHAAFCCCYISFTTYLMHKIWKFCKTLAHSSKQQYPSSDLERAEFLNKIWVERAEIFSSFKVDINWVKWLWLPASVKYLFAPTSTMIQIFSTWARARYKIFLIFPRDACYILL